jgi:hypothetical protein
MRIVDALKNRADLAEALDPHSHRLTTGTQAEQEQARREWRRPFIGFKPALDTAHENELGFMGAMGAVASQPRASHA